MTREQLPSIWGGTFFRAAVVSTSDDAGHNYGSCGGIDAEPAKFETFGPRFLDFQDKTWDPAPK